MINPTRPQSVRIKNRILLLIFITYSSLIFSQSITGIVIDKNEAPQELVSVALLKPADSVLVSFALTDKNGKFEISDAPEGDFLLQAFLSGYRPLYKTIAYRNKTMDIKNLVLEDNLELLEEVTITAVVPIQIKKDTIAYNAGSFKIHHDDNIEDLLRKLPGLEVDNDGTIKAQGNDITKIYVDGKEFFSGDPAIVLKNISAEAINKVEVIDKKSDEAEVTGINDAQKNYVINLTLRKNKKRRGFGKMAAGLGIEGRYFGDLNYNRFSNKMQFSVIGKTNDINVSGSNIQDFLDFTGGLADDVEEAESETLVGKRGLSGELTTRVAGLNYGHEFKKREVANIDYFYNYLDNSGTSESQRISFFKARNFRSESSNSSESSGNSHNVNFNYENKSNFANRLFIKGSLSSKDRFFTSDRDINYYDEEEHLNNNTKSFYSNNNDIGNGNIRINYFNRINENKRNFGIGMSFISNRSENSRDQQSINTNLRNNSERVVLTHKDEVIKNRSLNIFTNYTEPLGGNHFLRIQSLFTFRNGSEKANQVRTKNDVEQVPFLYDIKNKTESFATDLFYKYSTNLLSLTAGAGVQNLYRNFGHANDLAYRTKDVYINPKIAFRFKTNNGKNYSLNYKRSVQAPYNFQSAPIVNDINPNYIKLGNPDLTPQKFDNMMLNVNLNNYNSQLIWYSKVKYQHITDAIIPSLVVDENFIRTRSFQNYGSQDKITSEIGLNKKIQSQNLRYGFSVRGGYKTSNSVIDSEINDVVSRDYSFSASLENNRKRIIDTKIGASFSRDYTSFSVKKDLDRYFTNQRYFGKLDYDVSRKLNFNTQFEYLFFSDSKFQSNQQIPLWNLSLSYAITKNNAGILKFLIIDMLNKNVDIIRRSTVNYYEETTNQVLGRYLIMSFTYRLKGKPPRKSKKKNKFQNKRV